MMDTAASFASTTDAYDGGLERAALWHDEQAEHYRQRLARQRGRRDLPPFRESVGGVTVEFGGNHVAEYREQLQDKILSHEVAAKTIRSFKGCPMTPGADG